MFKVWGQIRQTENFFYLDFLNDHPQLSGSNDPVLTVGSRFLYAANKREIWWGLLL